MQTFTDVSDVNRITLFYDEKTARWLERQIRLLCYGDALVRRGYRLEYLCPPSGFPRYVLYRRNAVIGVQHVRAGWWLPEVQRKLAAYLTILGFEPGNTHTKIGGARTPLREKHYRLPRLFVSNFDTTED